MPSYPLTPFFSECGLLAHSIGIGITSELVRNAETQPSPQTCWFGIYIFTKSPLVMCVLVRVLEVRILASTLLRSLPYSKIWDCSWISSVVWEAASATAALSCDFQICTKWYWMLSSLISVKFRKTVRSLPYFQPLHWCHPTRFPLTPLKFQCTQATVH